MKLPGHLLILRPHQWLKNLMLFFPPFLGGALINPGMLNRGIIPFCAFSLASSATYVLNDLLDVERDRNHPKKKFRPLAAGTISRSSAMFMTVLLLSATAILASQVSLQFFGFVSVYLIVSWLYSTVFKDLPVIDIFCIALGFVLRLYAGGAAFDVKISNWLFLTVFLLALFLSVGKRYSERIALGSAAGNHRKSLAAYPEGFLEGAMYLSGSAVLVTYSLYVIDRPLLVYTVPLCMFGLLRYLFCVKSGSSGDPTSALLRDGTLLGVSIVWMVMVAWGIYQ